MGSLPRQDDRQELTVLPRDPVGWSVPDVLRCDSTGHEVESFISYSSGVLVGYCRRCDARFEVPWFKGGTAVAMAAAVAMEAVGMENPAPSVVIHLDDLLSMLRADAEEVDRALDLVQIVKTIVLERMPI